MHSRVPRAAVPDLWLQPDTLAQKPLSPGVTQSHQLACNTTQVLPTLSTRSRLGAITLSPWPTEDKSRKRGILTLSDRTKP